MTIGGYNGKILRVDLSRNSAQPEIIEDQFCRRYLGGAGFIAYFLWKELQPGIDALSPENKLIFTLGPVSGLTVPGAARNCIGAKSPLAGGIAKSEVGGFWMAELKRAGFDAIIVEGKAQHPVYLWIHDGEFEIRNASHLWGKETLQTEEIIRSELDDDHIQVAMIGPGGENTVRFACIMQGCHDAAGRGGLGAVMGSKNLKAIAVRGHTLPPVADATIIASVRKELTHPYPHSEYGTGGPGMMRQEITGDLPVRNFRDGKFPGVKNIHAGVIKDTVRIGMEGCFACPIRCKKVTRLEEPYKVDSNYGGPEYETLASLGSDCGIDDLKAIVKGNERCNAYSLDTISTGSTIAFTIECMEKGLIKTGEIGGLELKWGNAGAMLQAIDLIAQRKGFGDIMAEGTARMARKIGRGSENFAMNVKGLEAGMHDPRVASGLSIGFMVSPTGADHCVVTPDELLAIPDMFKPFHSLGWQEPLQPSEISPRKVAVFRDAQCMNLICDSLVVCQFPNISFDQMVELLKGVTGWDTGIPELLKIAERTLNLMRLFNLREGLTARDDMMPVRFFQPTAEGALANLKDRRLEYEKATSYYYALMGWDRNGVPLPEKIAELGIA
jgi:aldehyde:ferredoxin oxidoreductase